MAREVLKDGVTVTEGLLYWDDDDGAHPTWEPMEVIQRRFPHLILGDKDVLNEDGVDTSKISTTQPEPTPTPSAESATAEPEQLVFDASSSHGVGVEVEGKAKSTRPKKAAKKPDK